MRFEGCADLVIRKFDLPSMVEAVTGLEFTYTHLVYLGEKRRFARRPIVKHSETYDEDDVASVIAKVDTLDPPGPIGFGNPDPDTIRNGTMPEPGSPSVFAQ